MKAYVTKATQFSENVFGAQVDKEFITLSRKMTVERSCM
jgi:Mg/Co/Ni transporter MgtE